MNKKQNTLEIIKFGHPERITGGIEPVHGICYFGMNHENAEGKGHEQQVGAVWTDIWGTVWQKEHEGVMGFPRGNPLDDLSKMDKYPWPDPNDERLIKQIYTMAEGYDKETQFLVGGHRDTLWEKSYMLCGMENIMCYLYTEPEAAKELLHQIMDFQIGIAKHYLAVGVEAVNCGDDLGTQIAPLMSPEIMEEFFVPEYRRLFDLYKQHGVIINFHSCGHIMPLLETFIGLGIDILNPIQASANDLAEVRRITHGRMALQGGLSSGLLVSGPPESIRAEVKRLISMLGKEGGYFCAPDQGMPWPQEHYEEYEKALEEFGATGY
jgi:uroporphyrinogen decarboxylase